MLKDVSVYVDYSRRKTVTAMDVIYALKKNFKPIYGFDNKWNNIVY